jgi:hypothetical protein
MNYVAHWTVGNISSTTINSVSVELLAFTFCLFDFDKLYYFQSSKQNHSGLIVKSKSKVPFKYPNTRIIFFQSSLSGFFYSCGQEWYRQ